METPLQVDDFITVTLGFAVFLLGWRLNRRVAFLRNFNIPEPVTGGLLVAAAVGVFHALTGHEIIFATEIRDVLLVLFFAGIGLNARIKDLLSGGRILGLLLVLTFAMIVIQNLVGIVGASMFGFPVQSGVLFGSAALIGGHGTAIAWAPEVERVTGLAGAQTLGVAVATLGLVVAALIGGPIAKFLIERDNLEPSRPDEVNAVGVNDDDGPVQIEHVGVMRALLWLNVSVILGYILQEVIEAAGLKLPLFVPCLLVGIVLGNLQPLLRNVEPVSHTPALGMINEFALGTFLAISLMSLQLWTLSGLGPAIMVTLGAQTLVTIIFVLLILYPVLGRKYRSAVLASGFGGFALGATPTAIANMTAVTNNYGPSPIAFVVLPLVSAFFVDIANAVVIQTIVNF